MVSRKEAATRSNKWGKAYWIDLGERVGSTIVYGLITFLTLDNTVPKGNWDVLWPVVVLPTALALLKGLLANLASPGSGASVVPPPEGPAV